MRRKIWNLRRKAQIWMFMDLIEFLNEFIRDLIGRKLIFKSIWALIRRNLSSGAKIYFLGIY